MLLLLMLLVLLHCCSVDGLLVGFFGDFGERPLASQSQLHLHRCCSGLVLLSLECQASIGCRMDKCEGGVATYR